MKTWEAFKLLEEGYKVRRTSWRNGDYIKLGRDNRIVDKNSHFCPISLSRSHNDWEIYYSTEVQNIKSLLEKMLDEL